jgi:hypothetical protein
MVKSLCLTKYQAMKKYGGKEVQFHTFLTEALDWGEWSASRPGRFTSGERVLGTHLIGGWVDPRTGLVDGWRREKIHTPAGNQAPVIRYTYGATPFP